MTTCSPSRATTPCDHARVELALPAAPAEHLDLQPGHLVGELEQSPRGGEQLGSEVGGEAEREDVHVVHVDEVRHLLHLGDGVEACLVADQVVQPLAVGPALPDQRRPGPGRRSPRSRRGAARSGWSPAAPSERSLSGEHEPPPTLPGVVVVHLQRKGRLAAVHRAVEELQLSSVAQPAVAGGDDRPGRARTWSRHRSLARLRGRPPQASGNSRSTRPGYASGRPRPKDARDDHFRGRGARRHRSARTGTDRQRGCREPDEGAQATRWSQARCRKRGTRSARGAWPGGNAVAAMPAGGGGVCSGAAGGAGGARGVRAPGRKATVLAADRLGYRRIRQPRRTRLRHVNPVCRRPAGQHEHRVLPALSMVDTCRVGPRRFAVVGSRDHRQPRRPRRGVGHRHDRDDAL